MTDPDFATALKSLRLSRRPAVSQSRLAELAGVDHAHVSRLEGGTRRPSRPTALRLAAALGATDAERDRLLAAAGMAPEAAHDLAGRLLALLANERVPKGLHYYVASEVERAVEGAELAIVDAAGRAA